MPITFKKGVGWAVTKPTKDELQAIQEIGKRMIIEGVTGSYTNEKYKEWLETAPMDKFFNS